MAPAASATASRSTINGSRRVRSGTWRRRGRRRDLPQCVRPAATSGLAPALTGLQAARVLLSKPSLFGLPLTSNLFLRSRERFGAEITQPFITDTGSSRRSSFAPAAGCRWPQLQPSAIIPSTRMRIRPTPLAFDLTVISRLTATALSTRAHWGCGRGHAPDASTFEYGAARSARPAIREASSSRTTIERSTPLVFATSGRWGLVLLATVRFDQQRAPTRAAATARGSRTTRSALSTCSAIPGRQCAVGVQRGAVVPAGWRPKGRVLRCRECVSNHWRSRPQQFASRRWRRPAQTPVALLRVDLATP
jgi:hypothetical protein